MQEETPRSDRDVQLEELFPTVRSALDETSSSLQRSALLFDKNFFLYDLGSNRDLRFNPLPAGGRNGPSLESELQAPRELGDTLLASFRPKS